MSDEVLPKTLSLAVHELRTPLAVLVGYLRMALQEQAGALTDKQKHVLTEVERSAGRLKSLVDELSSLGKFEARQVALASQPFELEGLLAEVAARMHEGADRGVRIEVRSDGQPLPVLGDRARMAEAIGALMHSVLRQRGAPGVVVVDHSVTADARGRGGVLAFGDEAEIPALRDAAASPAPFDEWIGGQGLSLPLARRIIEAHGGTLWSAANSTSRAACALRLPLRT